jgi:hypothetical protein
MATLDAYEHGSAFVDWIGSEINNFLCECFDCTAGNDNCVSFEGMIYKSVAMIMEGLEHTNNRYSNKIRKWKITFTGS